MTDAELLARYRAALERIAGDWLWCEEPGCTKYAKFHDDYFCHYVCGRHVNRLHAQQAKDVAQGRKPREIMDYKVNTWARIAVEALS